MAQKPYNIRVRIPEELGYTSDDLECLKKVIKSECAGYAKKSELRFDEPPLQETNITSVGKRASAKKSGKASSKK